MAQIVKMLRVVGRPVKLLFSDLHQVLHRDSNGFPTSKAVQTAEAEWLQSHARQAAQHEAAWKRFLGRLGALELQGLPEIARSETAVCVAGSCRLRRGLAGTVSFRSPRATSELADPTDPAHGWVSTEVVGLLASARMMSALGALDRAIVQASQASAWTRVEPLSPCAAPAPAALPSRDSSFTAFWRGHTEVSCSAGASCCLPSLPASLPSAPQRTRAALSAQGVDTVALPPLQRQEALQHSYQSVQVPWLRSVWPASVSGCERPRVGPSLGMGQASTPERGAWGRCALSHQVHGQQAGMKGLQHWLQGLYSAEGGDSISQLVLGSIVGEQHRAQPKPGMPASASTPSPSALFALLGEDSKERCDMDPPPTGDPPQVADGPTPAALNSGIAKALAAWSPAELSPEEVAQHTKTLQRLVEGGVPGSLRGSVWWELSGAAAKACAAPPLHYHRLIHHCTPRDDVVRLIEKDVPRTWPGHPLFETPAGLAALERVLLALAANNPAIGYTQGLNMLAGFALTVMEEEQAFWLVDTLVNEVLPPFVFADALQDTHAAVHVLEQVLSSRAPALHRHLLGMQIPLSMVFSGWIMPLLTTSLPSALAFRVWDTLFLHGWWSIFDVCVNLVCSAEREIAALQGSPAEMYQLLSSLPSRWHEPSALLANVGSRRSLARVAQAVFADARQAIKALREESRGE